MKKSMILLLSLATLLGTLACQLVTGVPAEDSLPPTAEGIPTLAHYTPDDLYPTNPAEALPTATLQPTQPSVVATFTPIALPVNVNTPLGVWEEQKIRDILVTLGYQGDISLQQETGQQCGPVDVLSINQPRGYNPGIWTNLQYQINAKAVWFVYKLAEGEAGDRFLRPEYQACLERVALYSCGDDLPIVTTIPEDTTGCPR